MFCSRIYLLYCCLHVFFLDAMHEEGEEYTLDGLVRLLLKGKEDDDDPIYNNLNEFNSLFEDNKIEDTIKALSEISPEYLSNLQYLNHIMQKKIIDYIEMNKERLEYIVLILYCNKVPLSIFIKDLLSNLITLPIDSLIKHRILNKGIYDYVLNTLMNENDKYFILLLLFLNYVLDSKPAKEYLIEFSELLFDIANRLNVEDKQCLLKYSKLSFFNEKYEQSFVILGESQELNYKNFEGIDSYIVFLKNFLNYTPSIPGLICGSVSLVTGAVFLLMKPFGRVSRIIDSVKPWPSVVFMGAPVALLYLQKRSYENKKNKFIALITEN